MDKQPFTKFRLLNFIHNGDLITFHWCMCRQRQQQLTNLSKLISHSADGFYYLLIPLFMLLIDTANAQLAFITLTTAFVIERPIYSLLKKGLKRHRRRHFSPRTVLARLFVGLFGASYWACTSPQTLSPVR